MKTVQETLKNIDRSKLISEVYDRHHTPLYELEKRIKDDEKQRTVIEIIERFKKIYNNFIDRLISLPIQKMKNNDNGIFFVHDKYDTNFDNNEFALVYINELKEKGVDAQSYAFEFVKQEEIVGYLISDSKYTQDNLYELLAFILDEASFFGFENEKLEEEQRKLEESLKEIEEGKAKLLSAQEVFKEFDMDFEDENDEEKDEASRKCAEAIYEYGKIFFKREINHILEQI